jgi:hypothetical protein
MTSTTRRPLEEYVAASLKQGATLSAAIRDLPSTADGTVQREAAILAEINEPEKSN